MGWRDLVMDGMLVLVTAVVLVGGVGVVYFLVQWIAQVIEETKGEGK